VKRITFLSVAEVELAEAAQYYEKQEHGLGKQFLDAVREASDAIQRQPETWPFYVTPIRGCRMQSFPYRLLYRELADRVQIVAVMHTSRRPGYWKDRI
jgi:plasmid stabilization system protein ParE